MTRTTEKQSAAVPQAQQAEEILSRWRWVKPCAWTVRMLTALEQGVEGGKWFRLFDKVFAEHSYGFRPGRGCKDALRRVDQLLKAGYVHVVDADARRTAGGGAEPPAQQHLSRSARPPGGGSGLRDGALRRRLRHPLPHGGRRGPGPGNRPPVDDRQQPAAAPGEDE